MPRRLMLCLILRVLFRRSVRPYGRAVSRLRGESNSRLSPEPESAPGRPPPGTRPLPRLQSTARYGYGRGTGYERYHRYTRFPSARPIFPSPSQSPWSKVRARLRCQVGDALHPHLLVAGQRQQTIRLFRIRIGQEKYANTAGCSSVTLVRLHCRAFMRLRNLHVAGARRLRPGANRNENHRENPHQNIILETCLEAGCWFRCCSSISSIWGAWDLSAPTSLATLPLVAKWPAPATG